MTFYVTSKAPKFMHHSIPAAPSPPTPRATAGHLPAFSVPGVGHCKFWAAWGPGICQPRGYSRAFDTHAVSYRNITRQRILPKKKNKKKKQISSSAQGQGVVKTVKACSRFYACISSLLIKPKLHSETRELSTWINVFWLENQISVDFIWRTSFHI